MIRSGRNIRTTTFATLTVAALTLAACGSDDDADPGSDGGSVVETLTTSPEGDATDETMAGDADAVDTTGATGGALPVLADGEAPAERTFSITASGIEPSSIDIAVGENVTFRAGDDATYAVEVGGLDQATVSGGLIETFDFPAAGTYTATEVLSGATVTINVG